MIRTLGGGGERECVLPADVDCKNETYVYVHPSSDLKITYFIPFQTSSIIKKEALLARFYRVFYYASASSVHTYTV